jgi:hypothetical protein
MVNRKPLLLISCVGPRIRAGSTELEIKLWQRLFAIYILKAAEATSELLLEHIRLNVAV